MRAGDGLAEVTVRDEGRDMWQVYLERGLFSAAFRSARTQAQRNAVNVAEAEAALVAGDTIRAARLYGKVCRLLPCDMRRLGRASHEHVGCLQISSRFASLSREHCL